MLTSPERTQISQPRVNRPKRAAGLDSILGFGAQSLQTQLQSPDSQQRRLQSTEPEGLWAQPSPESPQLYQNSRTMEQERVHLQLKPNRYGAEGTTHYEVLNVSPSSTVEEIRASYRALLLSLHPDKVGSQSVQRNEQSGNDAARYLRVQEAWSVLRDADSRAVYDGVVKARAGDRKGDVDIVVGEEIALEDMEDCVSEETGCLEYWYPCRCSDFFVVGVRELQEAGLGFVGKDSGGAGMNEVGAVLRPDGDCGMDGGGDWGAQRQSIVLPCGSCSLHLRVHIWVPCA